MSFLQCKCRLNRDCIISKRAIPVRKTPAITQWLCGKERFQLECDEQLQRIVLGSPDSSLRGKYQGSQANPKELLENEKG